MMYLYCEKVKLQGKTTLKKEWKFLFGGELEMLLFPHPDPSLWPLESWIPAPPFFQKTVVHSADSTPSLGQFAFCIYYIKKKNCIKIWWRVHALIRVTTMFRNRWRDFDPSPSRWPLLWPLPHYTCNEKLNVSGQY